VSLTGWAHECIYIISWKIYRIVGRGLQVDCVAYAMFPGSS
jgi:hypothetical protein